MTQITELPSGSATDLLQSFAQCAQTDDGWRGRSIERWALTLREQLGLVHRLMVSRASVSDEELTEALHRIQSDLKEAQALSMLSAQLTMMWANLKQEIEAVVKGPGGTAGTGRVLDARAAFRSEK